MGKFLLEALNVVKLSHWPDREDNNQSADSEFVDSRWDTEFADSKWDTRSIDLETLPDEESRPGTPVRGKQAQGQGNMFYDDVEELMLGWAEGNHRRRGV